MTQDDLINKYFSTQITEVNLQKILLVLSSFGVKCPTYPNRIYTYNFLVIRKVGNQLKLHYTDYKPTSNYSRIYLKEIIKL